MTMPFYVAPEQMMKDRADYARKGIARGRALVACTFDDGVLICAENPSRMLRKISEIYDRIGFAGVGKYNEFDQLRIAGVRHADLKGFSFSREDVDARSLANQYAQILGQVFTHEMKPMEVEILVARGRPRPERGPAVPHPLRRHARRRDRVLRARRRGRGHRRADGRGLDRGQQLLGRAVGRRSVRWPAPIAPWKPATSRSPCSSAATVDACSVASRTTRSPTSWGDLAGGTTTPPPGARGCHRRRGSTASLSTMERRIYGLENEYGVTCTLRGQRRLSPDEVARYLFRRVVSWGRSSNVFLANGARLYLDVGSHPEYATPECDSLLDLVAHDKAGEWILGQLLESAEQRLAEEGIRGDIYLFRNNTDSAGNSYGCHENYLTSRDDDLNHYSEVLIPFLVSRQIYAGAGKVLQTARGAQFSISQRAEHIWEGVSSATTRSRPIINTRDEPHADSDRYRRLHVIVGDSNMSEYATFLKVGACSLILRMLEDPSVVLRDMTLENPIRAIREISHDITCTRRGPPGERTRGLGVRDPVRVPEPGPALRREPRPAPPGEAGAGHVGARHGRPRDRPAQPRPRGRLGHQAQPDRGVPQPQRPRAQRPEGRPARPAVPRHQPRPVGVLQAAEGRARRTHRDRRGDRRGDGDPAPDHPGPTAGRVHPPGQGAQAGLHRRLGAPEAERPGPAHGPVQGPVQGVTTSASTA